MQHVFIVGAKSLGNYGGYETFVNKLTEYHRDNKDIRYHIACKSGGYGSADRNVMDGVRTINDSEYIYNNAHCFEIKVPDIGPASAIYYDIESLKFSCEYIEKNKIESPVVYILACRIGPFMEYYSRKIHSLGGKVYINPDGHEWKRSKWPLPVKLYWKLSEKLMVKNADLVICDSINIEKYINEAYSGFSPKTTYISYGSETGCEVRPEYDELFFDWCREKDIRPAGYYLIVGRFVPENNYETIIREFMSSATEKKLIVITNDNHKLYKKLDKVLGFSKDERIIFAGTVYNQHLLMKIRKNAWGYIHGHEVGGTNPSLLEALGNTALNLVYDVNFNREVARDSALYWNKNNSNLAQLIDFADRMSADEILSLGLKAKKRIEKYYSWEYISENYRLLFSNTEDRQLVIT